MRALANVLWVLAVVLVCTAAKLGPTPGGVATITAAAGVLVVGFTLDWRTR